MQHSSPFVSSGMEPLVQDRQSCRGDNERKIKAKLEKGKSSWRNALRPSAPLSGPRGWPGRGGHRFIYAWGEAWKKWQLTLSQSEKVRRGRRLCGADLRSTSISISKGWYLHHSPFVKLIFQFLSCRVSSRSEPSTRFFFFCSPDWKPLSRPGRSKAGHGIDVINQITGCIIFVVFACHSDGWLTRPGAVQISHRSQV